jgi:hypothetical protein
VTTTVALRIYLLRFQIGHRRLSQNSGRIRRSFDVAPDSCPSYSFHAKSSLETQEVLEVLGVQVDLIRAVGMVGSDLFKNAGVFLSNFAELVELTGNFYTASDKSEAAWWTPIADHEHSSGESRRATDQFLTSRMKLIDKLDKVNYDDTDEANVRRITMTSTRLNTGKWSSLATGPPMTTNSPGISWRRRNILCPTSRSCEVPRRSEEDLYLP